ncbi:cleavage and polyadenylation specificity factor subunit 6-like isoform X1 [Cloeon dipterum]|uniref:cleavage and polyadenylation specificity factor subunit 6-like isoform X1 n=1 Tax=Cloeon dipterum TaxID=197152 RepID=UPI00321F7AF8
MADDNIDLYADDIDQDFSQDFGADGVDLYDDVIAAPSSNLEDNEENAQPPPTNNGSGPHNSPPMEKYQSSGGMRGDRDGGRRHQLYVGNLTWWTTDQDIANAVSDLGVKDFLEVKFFENRANGQSKGFCIISLGSDQSSRVCMSRLGDKELHGQKPVVTYPTKAALNQFQFEAQSKTRPAPQMSQQRGGMQQGGGPRNFNRGPIGGPGNQGPPPGPSRSHSMGFPPMQPFQIPPPGGPPRGPPPGQMHPNDPRGPPPRGDWSRPPGPGFPPHQPPPMQGPPPGQGPPMRGPPPGMMQPLGPPPGQMPAPHVNPAFFPPGAVPPHQAPPPHPGGPHGPPHGPPHAAPQGYGPPPSQPWPRYGPPTGVDGGAGISEAEFEEIMGRNRSVSSTAISRAVSDAAAGDYASAIETLVTAISLIKQSKVANDDRCKILISSLQDTLHGIEAKSYGSGRRERSRSRDRSHRRRRERSRSRERDYRERSRERDRDRYYADYPRERSRSREREYRERSREDSSSRTTVRPRLKSTEPAEDPALMNSKSSSRYYDERYRERERDARREPERERERREERETTHRSRH